MSARETARAPPRGFPRCATMAAGAGVRGDVRGQQSRRQFRRLSLPGSRKPTSNAGSACPTSATRTTISPWFAGPRHLQRRGPLRGQPLPPGISTSPDGNLCHYKWIFPEDDKLSWGRPLSTRSISPATARATTAASSASRWPTLSCARLGVPWLNRRSRGGVISTATAGAPSWKTPRRPMPTWSRSGSRTTPDGWLYKMQPWFEFGPFPAGAEHSLCESILVQPDALHHHRRGQENGPLPLHVPGAANPGIRPTISPTCSPWWMRPWSYGTPRLCGQNGEPGRHGELDARFRGQPCRRATGTPTAARTPKTCTATWAPAAPGIRC